MLKVVLEAFTRPANTTAYAAGDSVAPAALTVTGATNATPIVLTVTSHGLVTGDRVTVASVGGNTAANGNWTVTKVTDNTFSLDDSAGNGAYTSGGSVTRFLRLANVGAEKSGGRRASGKIIHTRLMANSATVTNGTFRVYFLTEQITQIADNAAWTLLHANQAKIVGHTGALTLITEGSGSDTSIAQDFTAIPFVCAEGSQDLFAVLVAEAGYTPTSGEVFYLDVKVEA